jgi:hypothetical protein
MEIYHKESELSLYIDYNYRQAIQESPAKKR